jgi:hypothetical protein
MFDLEVDGLHLTSVEVEVDVATDSATTPIVLDIPDGATVHAYSFVVSDEIAGVDSTTGTLSLTGGNTQDLGTIDAMAAGTTLKAIAPNGVNLAVSGGAANAALVLSGGADNTPTGGKVKLRAWYWTVDALSVS